MSGATAPPGVFGLAPPPINHRAEQAVLGALLANNAAWDLMGPLRAPHFSDPLHQQIFAAIGARCEAGRHVDAVALARESEQWADDQTERLEVRRYLADLLIANVGLMAVPEYAREIHECWLRRQLMDVFERAYYAARDTLTGTALDVLHGVEAELFQLAEANGDGDVIVRAYEPMAEAVENARVNRDTPGGVVGLRTGLAGFDNFTGGLRAGQLIYVGGRPSMGKTSFGLALAAGAAATQQNDGRPGARVLFVSREMPALALGEQLVAGLAPVPRDAAMRGRVRMQDEFGRFNYRPVTDIELDQMALAQQAMIARHLTIDECRAGTLAAVRSHAMRMKRRGGLDMIVADYLGLFQVPELARVGNRVLEVTRLSAECKALARDLAVPVVMLCQLSRNTEGRDDKRPGLADLRDSGSLEQDGDIVGFLYREHYYLSRNRPVQANYKGEEDFSNAVTRWTAAEAASRGKAELLVPKQRGGRVGKVDLAFDDTTTWFSDTEQKQ